MIGEINELSQISNLRLDKFENVISSCRASGSVRFTKTENPFLKKQVDAILFSLAK